MSVYAISNRFPRTRFFPARSRFLCFPDFYHLLLLFIYLHSHITRQNSNKLISFSRKKIHCYFDIKYSGKQYINWHIEVICFPTFPLHWKVKSMEKYHLNFHTSRKLVERKQFINNQLKAVRRLSLDVFRKERCDGNWSINHLPVIAIKSPYFFLLICKWISAIMTAFSVPCIVCVRIGATGCQLGHTVTIPNRYKKQYAALLWWPAGATITTNYSKNNALYN